MTHTVFQIIGSQGQLLLIANVLALLSESVYILWITPPYSHQKWDQDDGRYHPGLH